jgi:hypothetical protein
MSQQSLNIQEISSRTFNNDYSIMETSIEPIEKSSPYQFNKYPQVYLGVIREAKRTTSKRFADCSRGKSNSIRRP